MRSLVWTGIVAIIITASGARAGQQPGRPAPAGVVTILAERARVRLGLSSTAMVDRILSFDANGDNRIARDELPERMEDLIDRGDRNQDGFLTPDEIVPMVDVHHTSRRPPANAIVRRTGGLADVVADLKLPPETHDRALAIVNGPGNAVDPGGADFKAEMRELLDDEDYENYVAAVARLRKAPRVIIGDVGGVQGRVGGVIRAPAAPPR